MDIYIESFITSKSFLQFEIGEELDLSKYVIEKHYNPIGVGTNAYYFFNQNIDFELYTVKGLINSFDILLRNQSNELYLGNESNKLNLRSSTIDNFINYLNHNKLTWKFGDIISERSISIVYYSNLKMQLSFDCEINQSLSIINLF
jgi:hypothetical protein